MTIVFRVDSSTLIGTGHLMRCITLASGLRDNAAKIIFICRELNGNISDLVLESGFELRRLPEASIRNEIQETQEILASIDCPINWLIVDHYSLYISWEQAMRKFTSKIMVIDDLANREHDCNLLLDQNYHLEPETRYRDLVPSHCILLLGPKFALLRPEFRQLAANHKRKTGVIKKILVFFGGADQSNETLKVFRALQKLPESDPYKGKDKSISIDIVIGASNPRSKELQFQLGNTPGIHCHGPTSKIAELMAEADLFVGAGGATTWERLCLGLPSVVLSVAENQEALSIALGEEGYCLYLGKASSVSSDSLRNSIETLLLAPTLLKSFIKKGQQLVDGRGVERVLRAILSEPISLRRAAPEDSEAVHKWRNDPTTRQYVFDPREINFSEHDSWFQTTLKNNKRILLIAESKGSPVGVLRYDLIEEDTALTSIYLVPGLYGRNYGTRILNEGTKWMKQYFSGVTNLIAEIKPENAASLRAFSEAGYFEQKRVFKKIIQ